MKTLRFIDLFAGLGGFHLALKALGHNCVFASEIDEDLASIYKKNFGIAPSGDIRTIKINTIPDHDILCAGVPCQPFSKAGGQQGLECPQWGDLFDSVISILRTRKPEYFIIENVPNLVRHRNGKTWERIENQLRLAGYSLKNKKFSPHHFGVPQIRERTFIVGRRGNLDGFTWPKLQEENKVSIHSVLDKNPIEAKPLAPQFIKYLEAWQIFLDRFPKDEKLPSFPIWAMEFGATYPYVDHSPCSLGLKNLSSFKGSFGTSLRGISEKEILTKLPTYTRNIAKQFPKWKIDFIRQNRELYKRNKKWIDEWLPTILDFSPSYQKFEWNCKGEPRDIWRHILQFRASGIRVKRPITAPSLVAMTTSQVPVIAWEKRYMTIDECCRLQSMSDLGELPTPPSKAFKALGNAVNVSVVEEIAKCLLTKDLEKHRLIIKPQNEKQTRIKQLYQSWVQST